MPASIVPNSASDLAAIALKCLQKVPDNRYESAAALADDLDRWLNGEVTHARPASLLGQAWRWLRRHTTAALGVVALGTVTGLTAILVLFTVQSDREPYLYPPNLGLLNPLRLLQFTSHEPAGKISLFAAAAVLAVANGWFVKLAVRPRTPRLALAAACAIGAEMAGVDLILDLDQGRLVVLEVNAVPGWRALARVTGIDVAVAILATLRDAGA